MDPNRISAGFDRIIDTWETALEQYSADQLLARPSPAAWSMGQLYMHLVQSTRYFLKQVKICKSSDEHADESDSPNGRAVLSANDLPDILIQGPPSNAQTPQPANKEELRREFESLKQEMSAAIALVSSSPFRGKTRHFGLGYFTAEDWLQFTEIHFRHHLRQKKRLDEFLAVA